MCQSIPLSIRLPSWHVPSLMLLLLTQSLPTYLSGASDTQRTTIILVFESQSSVLLVENFQLLPAQLYLSVLMGQVGWFQVGRAD